MILAGAGGLLSIAALFVQGHYIIAFTLLLLNLLLAVYLLYGKLLKKDWWGKIEIAKDAYSFATAALITGALYCLVACLGSKEIELHNADIMMVSIYVVLLALMFVAIKIQKEEER
ncbi:MAG: hypothetical protein KDD37_07395 [Bdellovibrionales bacterium]|nr:hypothetical protein [Bdellovibrionales bacterium]